MKVGLIGAGSVGAACGMAMLLRNTCGQIVINDKDEPKARGLANDLSHGAPLAGAVKINAGSIADMADAAVIVITAGVNERDGDAIDRNDKRGRLLLLPANTEIYKDIVPQIAASAPDAVIVVVTDPPDPLADVVRLLMNGAKVLSTGTLLDSLRFRVQIAKRLGVDAASVEANVVGEHGTSQVYVWSSARIGGCSVLDIVKEKGIDERTFRNEIENAVKFANIEIIEGTGASQHGIGIVTARIVEAILRDERLVEPVAVFHPQYEVTLSLPAVVGRGGVIETISAALDEDETQKLIESAKAIREALDEVRPTLA